MDDKIWFDLIWFVAAILASPKHRAFIYLELSSDRDVN